MFNNKINDFHDVNFIKNLLNFSLGLEVERHRVNDVGEISTFPYPSGIGNQIDNEWITTDFLETMTEVVTPVTNDTKQALIALDKLSNVLINSLSNGELLWPLSMPPALPLTFEKIDIAHTTKEKRDYFNNWVKKYNFQRATPTGAHVNLGIGAQFISDNKLNHQNINDLYMKIARGFMKNRFVLTYFFGASPIAEENYFLKDEEHIKYVRSIRQSELGFGTRYHGDYSSVENYVTNILNGMESGRLLNDHDFHAPVRLRGETGINKLTKDGINHIELRMLDLDHWSKDGIGPDAINIIRLMAAYFVMYEEDTFDLNYYNQLNEEVSLSAPLDKLHISKIWNFIYLLQDFVHKMKVGQIYDDVLNRFRSQLKDGQKTVSARLMNEIKNNSLSNFALEIAKDNLNFTKDIETIKTIKNIFETSDSNISSGYLIKHLFNV